MSNRRYELSCPIPPTPSHPLSGAAPQLDFVYAPDHQAPLNARLLYVTSATYEGDWHSLAHSHAFSELFFILGGKGQFLADGQRHEVEKNDLVIINPQVEHTELSLESAPLSYIVLGIDGLCFNASSGDLLNAFSPIRFSCVQGRMRQYAELLLEEAQHRRPAHDAICQNLLNIILLLISRQEKVDVSITPSRNISSQCAALKAYIDNHFREPLTLETLADKAHQNKFYVAHVFKQAFGVSPIRYLIQRRIEESKYLLCDTNYSIGEISAIAGFSSSSVFSQTFRRLTAMSPLQYRKSAKTDDDVSP